MKKLLFVIACMSALPTVGNAADLGSGPVYTKAQSSSAVPYNWSGFYVGAHIGYGSSRAVSFVPAVGVTNSNNAKGVLGGGQIGYNYQTGSWVFGIEGDYSAADVKLNQSGGPGGFTATIKNDFFATAAGRVAYAFDRLLIFGKGGAAWTRDKLDVSNATGGTGTGRFDRTGWVAGAGIEYGILNNLSIKAEYNYLQFGNVTETLTTTGGLLALPSIAKLSTHIVKLGVNFRL